VPALANLVRERAQHQGQLNGTPRRLVVAQKGKGEKGSTVREKVYPTSDVRRGWATACDVMTDGYCCCQRAYMMRIAQSICSRTAADQFGRHWWLDEKIPDLYEGLCGDPRWGQVR
jgi:hypothetical protein